MTRRATVVIGLALLGCGVAIGASQGAPAAGTPPAPARKNSVYVGGVYDTGQFLPDTTVLARVQGRVIRIGQFVDAYFASYAQSRPTTDSLGRVEFLTSMVNKEVLALTALEIGRPEGFEDRSVLRGTTERVLANVLYQRAVLDSVHASESDIRSVYGQYATDVRYRDLRFDDPNTAETVRRALVAKRLTWAEAVRRYRHADEGGNPDGDMGWIARSSVDLSLAGRIWDAQPGEVPPVIRDQDGFHVMQLVDRRHVDPPDIEALRRLIAREIEVVQATDRADRLQRQVAARIGMAYDTTNINWVVAQMKGRDPVRQGASGPTLDLSDQLTDLSAADTTRVLARHRDGRFTVGDFVHNYNAMSPLMRRPASDFEAFRAQLDAMVFEPYMALEAQARGLDRDSMAVAEIGKKREELRVEHLYEDSVQSKVWIPPAERRKYYQDHIAQYLTYPSVRFAAIVRGSKAGADSLVARLRAGETAEAILRADSLGGHRSGSIQERRDDQKGPYHKILFGELKPGQATVVGPDQDKTWMVLQQLAYDPGRQLAYEEVQQYVDESLQNIHAEADLKALIARHARKYRIERHPELVMRIRLVDRALD